jgi:hypothetical protein
MRVNSTTVLRGRRVWLVPYRPQHVPIYHAWMQRPELLEQTCAHRMPVRPASCSRQPLLRPTDASICVVA